MTAGGFSCQFKPAALQPPAATLLIHSQPYMCSIAGPDILYVHVNVKLAVWRMATKKKKKCTNHRWECKCEDSWQTKQSNGHVLCISADICWTRHCCISTAHDKCWSGCCQRDGGERRMDDASSRLRNKQRQMWAKTGSFTVHASVIAPLQDDGGVLKNGIWGT